MLTGPSDGEVTRGLDPILQQAIEGLKAEGATEVHVFGSYAENRVRPESDLDLAIRGIPADRWFISVGRALQGIHKEVDILDLDHPTSFSKYLERTGRLVRVA